MELSLISTVNSVGFHGDWLRTTLHYFLNMTPDYFLALQTIFLWSAESPIQMDVHDQCIEVKNSP